MLLQFPLKDLKPLVEHTRSATTHRQTFGKRSKAQPGLWLVKDQGIYLMSNGVPHLPDPKNEKRSHCVYAEGFPPDGDYIGGDDYVEYVPLKVVESGLAAKKRLLQITLTSKHMEMRVM